MATGTALLGRNSQERVLSTRSWLIAAGFCAAVIVAWKYAEVSPAVLLHPATYVTLWQFVVNSFPPNVSLSFLRTVIEASFLTVATAIASTALSILFSVPLGMLACSSLWRTGHVATSYGEGPLFRSLGILSVSVRAILGFLRAVPDLVWALLFVAALGLGPLAGTLALVLSYTGVLGRVYADVFDAVDPRPLEALLSTGAGRGQIFLTAIWPQALPNLTAYTLYSFECCVRAAAVLGFVGAGGIGYEISLSMRLFDYRQVSTLLLAFIAILSMTDVASRKLRRFLNGDLSARRNSSIALSMEGMQHAPVVGARFLPRSRVRWTLLVMIPGAVLASFYLSGFAGIFRDGTFETSRELLRFASGLVPPDVSIKFLQSLWLPLMQTLAISLLGTLLGVLLGAPLSIAASSRLVLVPEGGPERRGLFSVGIRYAIYVGSRLVLSILRSIPELVWALICIVAIGIGPFAGTIALGLHTTGVLGKLYADAMEEVPLQPVAALRGLGASPLQLLLWAIWPQSKRLLGSYTVLRWDMNLRAATILGLVGGGGLGQVMYNDVQLGFYSRVATLIFFIYALVMATDWAGTKIWTALPK